MEGPPSSSPAQGTAAALYVYPYLPTYLPTYRPLNRCWSYLLHLPTYLPTYVGPGTRSELGAIRGRALVPQQAGGARVHCCGGQQSHLPQVGRLMMLSSGAA